MKESIDLRAWFEKQLETNRMHSKLSEAPLGKPWQVDPNSPTPLSRIDGGFFRVVHAKVSEASKREVHSWNQPLIRESNSRVLLDKEVVGVLVLIRKKIEEGQDIFLVQAKAEPGNSDREGCLLLAPSIQASFSNVLAHPGKVPLWNELDMEVTLERKFPGTKEATQFAILGKDGGRFYRKNNLLALSDIPEDHRLDVPDTHTWATREAIRKLQIAGLGNEHLAEVFGTFL